MFMRYFLSSVAVTAAISGAMLTFLAEGASAQMLSEGGFLDPGETVQHTFYAEAGQEVWISVTSSDFDTYLTLYGPGGRFVVENDDHDGSNAGASVVLNRTGTYTLNVGGYDVDAGRGRYFVTVEDASPTPAALMYEEGYLNPGGFTEYSFYGDQGQIINIALESADFDPYLRVYDPRNRLIAEIDDDGNSLNSRLTLELPRSGRYRFVVQGYSSEDAGQYALTVNE
jgi:hypothetical protein